MTSYTKGSLEETKHILIRFRRSLEKNLRGKLNWTYQNISILLWRLRGKKKITTVKKGSELLVNVLQNPFKSIAFHTGIYIKEFDIMVSDFKQTVSF